MDLKDFKSYIESFSKGVKFNYSISSPFSWRGSYDEVAFNITPLPSTREVVLEKIEEAYTKSFYGYKGGDYRYNDDTEIHFEEDSSRYTDGGYCAEWIAEIEDFDVVKSQEERLVKLIFN